MRGRPEPGQSAATVQGLQYIGCRPVCGAQHRRRRDLDLSRSERQDHCRRRSRSGYQRLLRSDAGLGQFRQSLHHLYQRERQRDRHHSLDRWWRDVFRSRLIHRQCRPAHRRRQRHHRRRSGVDRLESERSMVARGAIATALGTRRSIQRVTDHPDDFELQFR